MTMGIARTFVLSQCYIYVCCAALAAAAGLSQDEMLVHGTGVQREAARAAVADKLEDA